MFRKTGLSYMPAENREALAEVRLENAKTFLAAVEDYIKAL